MKGSWKGYNCVSIFVFLSERRESQSPLNCSQNTILLLPCIFCCSFHSGNIYSCCHSPIQEEPLLPQASIVRKGKNIRNGILVCIQAHHQNSMFQSIDSGIWQIWVQIPALPLNSCVNLRVLSYKMVLRNHLFRLL